MANGRRIASGKAGKQSDRQMPESYGTRRRQTEAADGVDGGDFSEFTGIRSLLNPLWCYHGFIVAVLALCCFGVIMVFSSSSVSLVSEGLSPWKRAINQGVYCAIGLACAFGLSRLKIKTYLRFCPVAMLGALFVQMLTLTPLGTGEEETGNNGWIVLGPVSLQPAELTKLALCVWMPFALLRASKRAVNEGLKAYAVPGLIYLAALGLIMLGKDLGTGLIVVFIGAVAFLIGGFPIKWMAAGVGVMAAGVGMLVITSPNRMGRILAAYKPCTDLQGVCYQSMHAKYALAEGGLLGVGLGNSREKWQYLPAAHTDFIYAIIGEETGFVGALTVLLLFVVIGWCLICVALQIRERYVAMVLVCIATWLVGQALVNIGVVIGIFPVLGVPMPFVSSGGSSMIMCLCAAGAAVGMMRAQPQIKAENARI
nr:putative lipid II flippase FtsW [Bifidobacterium simiiventris]